MLNETTIEKLSERLVNRVEALNSYVLKEIGGQIKRIGTLTPTNANRLINVLKYGGSVDNIVKKIAEITNLNVADIYKIFEELAKSEMYFAKQFYDYRGLNYVPYDKNIELQGQVKLLADNIAKNYLNLSNTMAFKTTDSQGNKIFSSLVETYQNTIDEAILSISQGKSSYQDSMKKTIKELADSGIRTVDYESGYSRRLDSSVRMNIMDGMRDLHNTLQEQIGKEVGNDGIEISVHENSALDHENYQGLHYSLEEYEQLNNRLERPISTMNCYHYIYSIILGVSEPRYSKDELEAIKKRNKDGFEFEDKKYTMYEGQQLQRRLETEIRKEKDLHIIASASGDNELIASSQRKISELTAKYKELSDISGLPTKLNRLKVEGFKRVNLKKLGE